MPAIIRLAGVAPDVDQLECTLHSPPETHSGFENQRRCYQKSKTGVSLAPKRSTSGATLSDLLATGAQLVTSQYTCAEVGLGSDLNGQSPAQKTNALPLCERLC